MPGLAAARTYTVTIKAMAFGVMPKGLHAGDNIEWINDDIFRHTATASDKSFDVDLKPGGHGRTILTKPGTLHFICRFHLGMTGDLVVARKLSDEAVRMDQLNLSKNT